MKLTKSNLLWIRRRNKIILTSHTNNVCIAEVTQSKWVFTLVINNFNTQHIYVCGNWTSADALRDYVIDYIKKDKMLRNRYYYM